MAITLKTDKQGLAIIDQARVKKNWTALAAAWCTQANVSMSTLKRFREKKAIQKDAFIAICQAVGIDNWQQIVSATPTEVAMLRRKYQQTKKVIAEEVLSNLDSLDARIEFVAQAFSNDPSEAQAQIARQKQTNETNELLNVSRRSRAAQSKDADITSVVSHSPLKVEANVSIIQIMMEI